jgi:hypothetical protein
MCCLSSDRNSRVSRGDAPSVSRPRTTFRPPGGTTAVFFGLSFNPIFLRIFGHRCIECIEDQKFLLRIRSPCRCLSLPGLKASGWSTHPGASIQFVRFDSRLYHGRLSLFSIVSCDSADSVALSWLVERVQTQLAPDIRASEIFGRLESHLWTQRSPLRPA